MVSETTVHTMSLEALRARAREARRLIAQAREIARISLDGKSDLPPPSEESDPSRRVGLLLDAAQRLLPGMAPLAEERAPYSRTKWTESGARRVTLRGGAGRALDTIERSQILETIASDAAGLIAEIERRSSSMLRTADVAPAPSERATRGC